MAQIAPLEIGPYQLFEEIGRGGMSIVYRAHDTRNGRIVALKVLPPELHHQDQLLNRFVKEGQSTLQLQHPNIVRTYEADVANGTYYMAMELVQGENLAEYLKRHPGPLPFDDAIHILRQVASGLDFAHSQGILHRDIKPSNILLNQEGRAQITDFGVARDLNADHTLVTMPGHSIGTPAYMSPEQARGDPYIDGRADVYSLGVVAYAMLTGKMPFEASSHLSLLRKIIDDAPTPPEVVNSQLKPGIARALKSVLAKDPQARYATATNFVAALEAGMAEPVTPARQNISDATVPDLPSTLPATPATPDSDATVSVKQPASVRRQGNPLLAAAARSRPAAGSKSIPRQFILKTTSTQPRREFFLKTTGAQPPGSQPRRGGRGGAIVLGAALSMLVILAAALLFDRFARPQQVEGTAVALVASPVASPANVSPTPTLFVTPNPTANPTANPTGPGNDSFNAAVVSNTETFSDHVAVLPAPAATATPSPLLTSTPAAALSTKAPPTPFPITKPAGVQATATVIRKATATSVAPVPTSAPPSVAPPVLRPTATPITAVTQPVGEVPEPGATRTNKVDGAIYAYIPAGKFSMGSTRQNDEKPLHIVDINAFWIMQTEVTNSEYALCIADGSCTSPHNDLSNNPDYASHPVVNIDWMQASAYAKWAGGRLPTEAEWEKAARGSDLRPFPWGANAPDATLLNFDSTISNTTPVMNYPLGISPYGIYDMAGNVEEWVADWYANDYYAASPVENPLGPTEGIFRVVRGGSYNSDATLVLTTSRGKAAPNRGYASVGFRVVQDK